MGKFVIICAAIVFTVASASSQSPNLEKILRRIERINKSQSSWTAGLTPISFLSDVEFKRMLGAVIPSNNNSPRNHIQVSNNIPASFDPREQWPECANIWAIKDQGNCLSCYAVSTTSAASDRLCIATNYKIQVNISAENVLSCCPYCPTTKGAGCSNGDSLLVWRYLRETGVVTGGDYDSNEGCQPYEIPPKFIGLTDNQDYTPPCATNCTNPSYNTNYNEDLHYGSTAYILPEDVSQIQTDLMTNGPLVAGFKLYSDFVEYNSGVYHHISGDYMGIHYVRLLGWGTDEDSGEDYWLGANSWNRTWGENGYFRMRRLTNNCSFEHYVTGGLMLS